MTHLRPLGLTATTHNNVALCKAIVCYVILCLCALGSSIPHVWADTAQPFFILSDRSYASTEEAQVRLEVEDVNNVHAYGGVDIALYRVPDPIAFLSAQRNLNRIQVTPKPNPPKGLWNVVIAVWDSVKQQARTLWRQMTSEAVRTETVETAHALKTKPDLYEGHPPAKYTYYQPLDQYTLIAQFRYPLQFAQDIKTPDVNLLGANVEGDITTDDANTTEAAEETSTDETNPEEDTQTTQAPVLSNGKVYVGLGHLKPGLYVVEAMIGEQRAVTHVLVSDHVAITKTMADGLVAYTVNRISGVPAPEVQVYWHDGLGLLGQGTTNAQGWVTLNHTSPEQTYVFGVDAAGGVFVSENYYYDSEIYNTKLYATTDRPLYRPNDWVKLSVMGRYFKNAQTSTPLDDAPIQMEVVDPNGMVVAHNTFTFSGTAGGSTQFRLPSNSVAGGYELHLQYKEEWYSAAFRVSEFNKPHFEIALQVDPEHLKTKHKIPVQLHLSYPNGQPVTQADVDIDLKAQPLSIVEGQLDYGGEFPVKLSSQQITTDNQGNARVDLPETDRPSRYIVSVLATDGAAYRVRHTQELLIERSSSTWQLHAAKRFSAPNEPITFNIKQTQIDAGQPASLAKETPTRWQWIRLEDQSTEEAPLTQNAFTFAPKRSGSYTLNVLSSTGTLLGATSHWVSGAEVKVPTGYIEFVWDKATYHVGETAHGLISFSEPVEHALVSLERDQVEALSSLAQPAAWLKTKRIAPNQWQIDLPVTAQFAPNMTVSVAYVKNNAFVFENAGIVVASPHIEVNVHANKPRYLPNEDVELTLETRLNGQAIPAWVNVSVVDEMIYVLQPEIAPTIQDFFYHPRRNNVRTQYSQNFIGYDVSSNAVLDAPLPTTNRIQERAIKVLERPKRDDVDTAFYAPAIQTNADGKAVIRFKMPDVLARWRITTRAMAATGEVGQSIQYIQSHKDYYMKWTSSAWLREGDWTQAQLAVFNQTAQNTSATLRITGALQYEQSVTLTPGANFIALDHHATNVGDVNIQLIQSDRMVDQIHVTLTQQPQGWLTSYNRIVYPENGQLLLKLPADATQIELRSLQQKDAAFLAVVNALLDTPMGSVEETASTMIPLSLAYAHLSDNDVRKARIERTLYTQRIRLASMATEDAQFAWWGWFTTADPFITTYAYYADYITAQQLHIPLADDHFEPVQSIYSEEGVKAPVLQRALMLDWMKQMGLPVGSLASQLAQDIVSSTSANPMPRTLTRLHSVVFNASSASTTDMAILLVNTLGASDLPKDWASQVAQATQRVQQNTQPLLVKALLHRTGHPVIGIDDLLVIAQADQPSLDRALALLWVNASDSLAIRPLAQPTPAAQPLPPTPATVAATPTTPAPVSVTSIAPAATTAPVSTTSVAPTPVAPAAAVTPAVLQLNLPWVKTVDKLGTPLWRWIDKAAKQQPLPQSLVANQPLSLRYRSALAPQATSTLAGTLTRTLYRLVRQEDGTFDAQLLKQGEALHTNALYLDQVQWQTKTPLRDYIAVNVPLPVGAMVEPSTWGIKINDMEALERANYQENKGYYTLPLGKLLGEEAQTITVNHLLRVNQAGQFVLPPAYAYSVYQPDKQCKQLRAWPSVQVK